MEKGKTVPVPYFFFQTRYSSNAVSKVRAEEDSENRHHPPLFFPLQYCNSSICLNLWSSLLFHHAAEWHGREAAPLLHPSRASHLSRAKPNGAPKSFASTSRVYHLPPNASGGVGGGRRRRHVVRWKRPPASRLVVQPAQDGTGRTGQCPRLQKGQKSEFLRVAHVMWTSEASRAKLTRIGALSFPAAVTGSAHNRMPPSPYFPIQQSSWMVDKETPTALALHPLIHLSAHSSGTSICLLSRYHLRRPVYIAHHGYICHFFTPSLVPDRQELHSFSRSIITCKNVYSSASESESPWASLANNDPSSAPN